MGPTDVTCYDRTFFKEDRDPGAISPYPVPVHPGKSRKSGPIKRSSHTAFSHISRTQRNPGLSSSRRIGTGPTIMCCPSFHVSYTDVDVAAATVRPHGIGASGAPCIQGPWMDTGIAMTPARGTHRARAVRGRFGHRDIDDGICGIDGIATVPICSNQQCVSGCWYHPPCSRLVVSIFLSLPGCR